eukprot:2098944-Rhodomonas_salina.1
MCIRDRSTRVQTHETHAGENGQRKGREGKEADASVPGIRDQLGGRFPACIRRPRATHGLRSFNRAGIRE